MSNVSHELRTPISVIRANAETLMDGGLDHPERALRFVDAIVRNTQRLSWLVEDLLDLSRIGSGGQRIAPIPINLSDALRAAIETLAPTAESRGVSLDQAVPSSLMCAADRRALDQVLVNLIDNAIGHGAEGGRVRIRGRQSGDAIIVEVIDDGPGIDPVHRQRVFERFYRTDPGRARHMGGTGLGLAIVKHLVELMNGTVAVDSAEPRGSIFRVRLPATPQEQPGAPDVEISNGDV